MNTVDIAWAAGFLDGEGCLIFMQNDAKITVSQKDPRPLLKLKGLFGGAICKHSRGIYVWQLTTNNCYKALEVLIPHLTVKKEQAELLLVSKKLKRSINLGRTKLTETEINQRKEISKCLSSMKRTYPTLESATQLLFVQSAGS